MYHLSLLASEGIEPLFRLKKSVLNLERPKAALWRRDDLRHLASNTSEAILILC